MFKSKICLKFSLTFHSFFYLLFVLKSSISIVLTLCHIFAVYVLSFVVRLFLCLLVMFLASLCLAKQKFFNAVESVQFSPLWFLGFMKRSTLFNLKIIKLLILCSSTTVMVSLFAFTILTHLKCIML